MYICIVNSQDTPHHIGFVCAPLKDLAVPEPDICSKILNLNVFSIMSSSSFPQDFVAFFHNHVFVCSMIWPEWLSAFVQNCDDTEGLFKVCFIAE